MKPRIPEVGRVAFEDSDYDHAGPPKKNVLTKIIEKIKDLF